MVRISYRATTKGASFARERKKTAQGTKKRGLTSRRLAKKAAREARKRGGGSCGGSDLQCVHPACKGEERVWAWRACTGEGPTTWLLLYWPAGNSEIRQYGLHCSGLSSFLSGQEKTTARQGSTGLYGVGLTVKESIGRKSVHAPIH